jgi:HSP20 family protein
MFGLVCRVRLRWYAASPRGPGERQGSAGRRRRAGDRVLYRERSTAAHARTLALPAEVDQTQSEAEFENRVLTLTLAKKVPAGATQLSIA